MRRRPDRASPSRRPQVRHSDRTAHGKIHRGLPRHSSGQRLEPRAADEKSGVQIATLRLESSGERVERPRRRQIVSGGRHALNFGKKHLQIAHSPEHVLDTLHCRDLPGYRGPGRLTGQLERVSQLLSGDPERVEGLDGVQRTDGRERLGKHARAFAQPHAQGSSPGLRGAFLDRLGQRLDSIVQPLAAERVQARLHDALAPVALQPEVLTDALRDRATPARHFGAAIEFGERDVDLAHASQRFRNPPDFAPEIDARDSRRGDRQCFTKATGGDPGLVNRARTPASRVRQVMPERLDMLPQHAGQAVPIHRGSMGHSLVILPVTVL
jgi:hypothetical protein